MFVTKTLMRIPRRLISCTVLAEIRSWATKRLRFFFSVPCHTVLCLEGSRRSFWNNAYPGPLDTILDLTDDVLLLRAAQRHDLNSDHLKYEFLSHPFYIAATRYVNVILALFASVCDTNAVRFTPDGLKDFLRRQAALTQAFMTTVLNFFLNKMNVFSSFPQTSQRRLRFKRSVGKSEAFAIVKTFF